MRIRDLQQFLSKFTNGQKGTAISDCEVYIEMQNGHLAKIKKMELDLSKNAPGRENWEGNVETAHDKNAK